MDSTIRTFIATFETPRGDIEREVFGTNYPKAYASAESLTLDGETLRGITENPHGPCLDQYCGHCSALAFEATGI